MEICSIFQNTLDYFLLDERDAEDVIFFICRMKEKGEGTTVKAAESGKWKKVYADQVDWY